ncbi:MAG: YjfB family protein [Candidatus Muiribacteriota bacterium]
MRIAGELSSYQSGNVKNDIQVAMLKKTMDVTQQTAHDLMSALVEGAQGVSEHSSHLGRAVDFYA